MTNPTEAPMANAIDDVKEWVLVPKVPTIAMMDAVHGGMAEQRELYIHIFTADVWEAMINAAPSQHTGWSDEAVEAVGMGWGELLTGYQRICAEHGIEPTSRDVLDALARHNSKEPVELPKPFCYTASLNIGPRPTLASYFKESIYEIPLYTFDASSIAPATEMEMLLTREQVEVIDTLDSALCQFLNNAGDEFDPREWLPSVQRDFRALSEAYNACHVAGIMELRKARASISPSVAKESGEP